MLTCKYDSTNHTFKIMDTGIKRGIDLLMIGDGMAQFLKDVVKRANQAAAVERQTDDVVIIDGHHYRAMNDNEAADFIWAIKSVAEAGNENKQDSNQGTQAGTQIPPDDDKD